MQKIGQVVLRLALPLGLFVYLLWRVPTEDYVAFAEQPKHWGLLVAAQILGFVSLIISFLRWRILVRAFDIPFSITDSVRFGFIGYMLNFVSFGSVGGDLFKAVLVARGQPEKRPESVASVLLDRAIGLLGLVILAWLSLTMLSNSQLSLVMLGIQRGAAIIIIISVAGLLVAIYAGEWFDKLLGRMEKIAWVGDSLARMARAVRLLRTQPIVLLNVIFLSVVVHLLLSLSIYFISSGVYAEHPSLRDHLMVVPPAMAAGTLPIAPGGLGVQEGAIAGLFQQLPNLPEQFSGVLVATVFRLVTLTIAGIGAIALMALRSGERNIGRAS